MRSRIDRLFEHLRDERRAAFIAYVCGGDPDPGRSLQILCELAGAGVDVVEIGVPFSDPLADGVVNQMAAERALKAGASLVSTLQLVRDFRSRHDTPLVLFTYLNPIYTYGFERFQADALEAGADAVLLLDLPPDEARLNDELQAPDGRRLQSIRLIAPTTPLERARELAAGAEGFIYYVSREGVTGEQTELAQGLEDKVAALKAVTEVPIAVGFGISTPDQAAHVARAADGVVVGSAIVRTIERHRDDADVAERVAEFVRPLVAATRHARDTEGPAVLAPPPGTPDQVERMA